MQTVPRISGARCRVDTASDFRVEGTGVQNHLWPSVGLFGRRDRGSKPPACFKTWANLFTPLCSCLSEETLKAVGPFYLVSMPGEVKDPTQGVNV